MGDRAFQELAQHLEDGAWPALRTLELGANEPDDPLIDADPAANRARIESACSRRPPPASGALHVGWDA
eukprot:3507083-Prymnesium_polylepis.1